MQKNRLEAFSDGVIAIIITIMVLELKVPHDPSWAALQKLAPVFISYVLSFLYVGIYWNNHHHMLHTIKNVHGGVLWANLHLLFWLSLIPFSSGWVGENHFADIPVVVYSANLLMCALAYTLLQGQIIRCDGATSLLAEAVGADFKGKISLAANLLAIILGLAGFGYWAMVITGVVALGWLIPDKRIERVLKK